MAGISVQAHKYILMPEFYRFWRSPPNRPKFITANMLQTPNIQVQVYGMENTEMQY